MNTQQQKLLAIAAVVLFHGAVITVMLAQHGCKSDGSKPSAAEMPAQPAPVAPVIPPPGSPTAADNGFVEPTRPPPETPVTPVPVAQFSEPLTTPTPLPMPVVSTAPVTAMPEPAPAPMTVTYVVSRGETLTSIARKNGITVDELVAANAPKVTRTSVLQPNQSLNIPNSKPAPMAPAPVATDGGNTYKVAPGDNLSKIAVKFHTTVKALQELNGLTSTNLRAGQVIKVPDSSTSAPIATPAASTAASGGDENTYKVKSGDSLDKISREVHVSVSELKSLNGLTDATARTLHPGQVLKLPPGTQVPASTAPTSPTMSAPPPVSIMASPASSSPPPVTMPVMAVPTTGSGAPPMTPVQ